MNIITSIPPQGEPVSLVEVKAHVVQDQDADDQLLMDMITAARELVEQHTWRKLLIQTVIVSQDNWNGYVIELPVAPIIAVTGITYVDTDGVTQTLDPSIWQEDLRSHIPRVMPTYGSIWPPVQLLTPNAVQVTCVVGYGAPFSTTEAEDDSTLQVPGNQFDDGTCIQIYNSGGALPAGLKADTNYFVVNSTDTSIQLSLTNGGSAVTFTDDGSGINFAGIVPRSLRQAMLLYIGLQYNNREAAIVDNRAAEVQIPFGLQAILDRYSLKVF
jgi:uncharacterized phiE125 gp8 family phage protein